MSPCSGFLCLKFCSENKKWWWIARRRKRKLSICASRINSQNYWTANQYRERQLFGYPSIRNYWTTKSMELLSAPRLLWNQNLHCHTHSSPPMDRIPSRLRIIPKTSPHVVEIRFKIILRSTPKCSKWYIIFRSACQNLAHRITKSKFNQHGCWGQGGRRFLVLARCSHTVNCCDAETVHRPERSETHRRKIRSDETKLWRYRIQDLRVFTTAKLLIEVFCVYQRFGNRRILKMEATYSLETSENIQNNAKHHNRQTAPVV